MEHLHIVPRLSRPTDKGINKRVHRMEATVDELRIVPQEERWTQRAQIKGGFSIRNFFKACQTYAVPLLLGIICALIWANVDPENYAYWFGALEPFVCAAAVWIGCAFFARLAGTGTYACLLFGMACAMHPLVVYTSRSINAHSKLVQCS